MEMLRLFHAAILVAVLASASGAHAQTCNDAIPGSTPTIRFVINTDGAVTDSATGLMWQRCAEGQTWNSSTDACDGIAGTFTWQLALQRAQQVNAGTVGANLGYSGWRVPNQKELASIVERRCYSPAINESVFPGTPTYWFWSGSTYAYNSDYAWSQHFDRGNGYPDNSKGSYGHVRLVRGGYAPNTTQYGTTVITHGFVPFANNGGLEQRALWVLTMARSIAAKAGNATIYIFNNGQIDFGRTEQYGAGAGGGAGEAIIVYDWLRESDQNVQGYAEAAGDYLAASLIDGAVKDRWSLTDLHFIGHSRGAVVNSEAIQRLVGLAAEDSLGDNRLPSAISIDRDIHMTTLDPHPATPFDGLFSVDDDLVNSDSINGVVGWRVITEFGSHKVTYSDNYFQDEFPAVGHPTGRSSFNGVSVVCNNELSSMMATVPRVYRAAIFNQYSNPINFPMDSSFGTIYEPSWFLRTDYMNHSSVHAWYQGTIDTDAVDDGNGLDIAGWRENWYSDNLGGVQGFYFSRLGGGPREQCMTDENSLVDVGSDTTLTSLFNGDFEKYSPDNADQVPGWDSHGGGGSADVLNGHLELYVNTGPGIYVPNNYRRHNAAYIPADVDTLQFRVKVVSPGAGISGFPEKFIVNLSGRKGALEIYQQDLTNVYSNFVLVSVNIRPYRGSVRSLEFQILDEYLGVESLSSEVWVDDVSFCKRGATCSYN